MRAALLVVLAAACGKHGVDEAAAHAMFDTIELPTVPPGESDLTVDDRGKIWAIAERDRFATEIELHGSGASVVEHPIDGVPDGNDTESIGWLAPGRFAIGIEGQQEPTAGILFAELRPDGHLAVARTRMLTEDEMGVKLVKNHGTEAVCGKGDDVIAGIEERGTFPDGTRWAPLVRLSGDRASLVKLHLTTSTGKLAALDCHFLPDGAVDFVAIERHYGVQRILHGVLAPGATEVTPELQLDLAPAIHDAYNVEGIARLSDGRTVLVNDNQSAHIDGTTKLFVLKR
jgi:hypothetical protein